MIEDELFKRCIIDYKKLVLYGFLKDNNIYVYERSILDNKFRVEITIDNDNISGKVFDNSMNDEYTLFRVKNKVGSFASIIEDEYIKILRDIKEKCFIEKYFISNQANRLALKVKDLYKDEPLFMWDSTPGCAVFKNKNTGKWYGLITNLDKSKLDKNENGEIEILNVKIDDKKIPDLLNKEGFYPAYHMNKKYWISIVLDDKISDEEIIEYIIESYGYTK